MSTPYDTICTTIIEDFPPVQHSLSTLREALKSISEDIAAPLQVAQPPLEPTSNEDIDVGIEKLRGLLSEMGTKYQQLYENPKQPVDAVEGLYA
jgi:hypothetical protein